MGYLYIVITTLLLAHVKVEGLPTSCAKTYKEMLEDLVTLKGKCDVAGFEDCCQVCMWVSSVQYSQTVLSPLSCVGEATGASGQYWNI